MCWMWDVVANWCAVFAGSAVLAPSLRRGEGSSNKGKGAVRFKGHRPRAHRHQALAQVGGLLHLMGDATSAPWLLPIMHQMRIASGKLECLCIKV